MNSYEFELKYFNEETEKDESSSLTVEANTKWGAWSKALYQAMEKESESIILVEIDFVG